MRVVQKRTTVLAGTYYGEDPHGRRRRACVRYNVAGRVCAVAAVGDFCPTPSPVVESALSSAIGGDDATDHQHSAVYYESLSGFVRYCYPFDRAKFRSQTNIVVIIIIVNLIFFYYFH